MGRPRPPRAGRLNNDTPVRFPSKGLVPDPPGTSEPCVQETVSAVFPHQGNGFNISEQKPRVL